MLVVKTNIFKSIVLKVLFPVVEHFFKNRLFLENQKGGIKWFSFQFETMALNFSWNFIMQEVRVQKYAYIAMLLCIDSCAFMYRLIKNSAFHSICENDVFPRSEKSNFYYFFLVLLLVFNENSWIFYYFDSKTVLYFYLYAYLFTSCLQK